LKAWLGFLDESAFSQRPPVRATWAPKGRTPCLREPFNWKRLSGIGLVLTTPTARRLRWFLTFHPGGIRSAHLVRFLAALRRHRRRRVLLLWDRLPAHRSRLTQSAFQQHRRWLTVEWLPAYAPELNPIEPLWAYLDTTVLANTPHDNLRLLRRRVRGGLACVQAQPRVGRGFLKYTKLF
jgi:transposase